MIALLNNYREMQSKREISKIIVQVSLEEQTAGWSVVSGQEHAGGFVLLRAKALPSYHHIAWVSIPVQPHRISGSSATNFSSRSIS